MCSPRGKCLRERGDKIEALPADRVSDAEAARMEHESTGLSLLSVELGVDNIPDDGTADVMHVHADLVGAPGVENTVH